VADAAPWTEGAIRGGFDGNLERGFRAALSRNLKLGVYEVIFNR
jgi:hypothetical protein